ncbi:glycoside hydrolase family 2 protein [Pseudolysinimonas sp.]
MRDFGDLSALEQGGVHPRPQLVRDGWCDLSGPWQFAFDDADEGVALGWAASGAPFPLTITVPYPPESVASGVGDPGYHRVVWYRRHVTADEVATLGHGVGRSLLLHFGAVDYRADVWIDGAHVARHEGGHTPFSAEVLDAVDGFEIVVRAEDDPLDLAQPRGKQDWAPEPHIVWYHRTTGIWQTVWLESVPRQHVRRLAWMPRASEAAVRLRVELARRPEAGTLLRVAVLSGAELLGRVEVEVDVLDPEVVVSIAALRNGQARDAYLWSPENPVLLEARIEVATPGGPHDVIASYLGLRDVGESGGRFLLNGRPHEVRGVLSQGYWPQSHLAAPNRDALRAEVELIKSLGFTTVRVHQKIEDPRFLYWADRLGLLVWAELPSAYEFSPTSSARLLAEWSEVVRRDVSHPSIVVWVPFNESWGVQDVAVDARQAQLVRALRHATLALDDSRLVVSNDGWEHVRSDLLTVHDYENDAARLLVTYGTAERFRRELEGFSATGRRLLVGTPEECAATASKPVILSEFGGVSTEPTGGDSWGYRHVDSIDHLEEHLVGLFAAVRESEVLAGWCYTQLTDTAQETNGLVDENRVPKLPVERIRALVEGSGGVRQPTPSATW